MSVRTNDLELLRKGARFTWGPVVQIHDVGRYTIVEHLSDSTKETNFHAYVDGKDTRNGFQSLDSAIIGAIAIGNVENVNDANTFGRAACRILGVKL